MEDSLLYPFRSGGHPHAAEAEAAFREAYRLQMKGNLDEAVRLYKKSIALFPTAEAHTFLGWTYRFQGNLEGAIEECRRAIEVDPDFGNPYNDIGAYLIELGRPEEAIPWLRRAMQAPRYEPRHFPHVNLARAHSDGKAGRRAPGAERVAAHRAAQSVRAAGAAAPARADELIGPAFLETPRRLA
jgi:Tfp pilus assembly protein PilF